MARHGSAPPPYQIEPDLRVGAMHAFAASASPCFPGPSGLHQSAQYFLHAFRAVAVICSLDVLREPVRSLSTCNDKLIVPCNAKCIDTLHALAAGE